MQFAPSRGGMRLLPGRFGPRPRTSPGLPFRQLDQFPPAEMIGEVAQFGRALGGVRTRESRMAEAGTVALSVSGAAVSGTPQAFIDGDEFCHLLPAPCGSLLLTLPPAEIEGVDVLGWAARHPIQTLGLMQSMVLVYGPRTLEELEVVAMLVERSCRFARGLGPPGAAVRAL